MKTLFSIILLALAGFACTETIEPVPAPEVSQSEMAAAQAPATLAAASYATMPNPYSLSNMRATYSAAGGSGTLQPTHLYVRFRPQDSLQMRRLKYDLNLELFDYPLNIELAEGEVYVDPTIPEGQLTWQYTTVPANFAFPSGITYQILEQCYIPEEFPGTLGGQEVDLEKLAFERAGYTVETGTLGFLNREKPEGTITVYDNAVGRYVPVKGVKVRCHTVVKWSTDFTDENGKYVMGSRFRIGPHYAIVFDNSMKFDIWGNWGPLARANYNMGWHSKSGYDKQLGTNLKAWEWATVNNAGYDYYKMCEQTGIRKPPVNLKIWVAGLWGNSAVMLRRVHHPIGYNGHSDWWNFFINIGYGSTATLLNSVLKVIEPDITINAGSNVSRTLYETTSHELSHASHFSQVGSAFWAKYISYIMTYGAYGNGQGNNAELVGIGEMWGYAAERVIGHEKYGSGALPNNYPGTVVSNWIKPHVFWKLIAEGTLTKRQVFDCLTAGVDTYNELVAKMYQLYPTKATQIHTAFASNGFAGIPSPTTPPAPTYRDVWLTVFNQASYSTTFTIQVGNDPAFNTTIAAGGEYSKLYTAQTGSSLTFSVYALGVGSSHTQIVNNFGMVDFYWSGSYWDIQAMRAPADSLAQI